jgi:uncharacterized protein
MKSIPSDVQMVIETLGLRPHPEGGYFRETFRSTISVATGALARDALTSIYYMLWAGEFSAFHRIASDEIWHHYRGSPVTLEMIGLEGVHAQVTIGTADCFQVAIPPNAWFAAHVDEGYALVGCDVAPGFSFDDFMMGSREELVAAFPNHRSLIERFTRKE